MARSAQVGVLAVFWLLALGFGFSQLMRYEATPGEAAPATGAWPAGSRIVPQADMCNLIMALHPRCPCSRASLEELSGLLANCPQPVRAHILVFKPASRLAGWERGELWEAAQRLPNTSLVIDEDGVEAARFGARTSGQTLLYDKNGRLLFAGDITAGRGTAGDHALADALCARLADPTAESCCSPVFGCPLRTPSLPSDSTGNP